MDNKNYKRILEMDFCLEEQGFNTCSSNLNDIVTAIVKKEKGKVETMSWDDYIKALHEFYDRTLLRNKEQQKFLNEVSKREEKEINILKIEWVKKEEKVVKITFNDFLRVDIKLNRLKETIDEFLTNEDNSNIYRVLKNGK